jgi:hypothetical protein
MVAFAAVAYGGLMNCRAVLSVVYAAGTQQNAAVPVMGSSSRILLW